MDTTQLVLLLSDVPGVGDRTLGAVLRRNAILRRTPEEFLALDPDRLAREYGLRRTAAMDLHETLSSRRLKAVETARQLRRADISVVTCLDASYPHRLLERMEDPPPAVYLYGNHALFALPLFATAVSNEAPEEALRAIDAASTLAVEAGWSPVTGHNRAAYQRPALAAMRVSGRILFVLDRGLLDAFEGDLTRDLFAAARIWSAGYDPKKALTLSPFGLWDHAIAANNRRRDELIFALADVVFAAGVRAGGQMERQCRRALAIGKPVFLVGPGGEAGAVLEAEGALAVPPTELATRLQAVREARFLPDD